MSTTRQTLPTLAGEDMFQVRTVFTTSNPSDVQSTATSERVLTTTGQTRHEVHVTGTYSPHIPSPTWLIACGIAIVMAFVRIIPIVLADEGVTESGDL